MTGDGGAASRLLEAALERTGEVGASLAMPDSNAPGTSRPMAFVVPAHPALRTLPPGNRWTSPGRFELAVQSRTEAAYFHREIFERECYLGGAVTLDGVEVEFDVGANVGMFSLFVAFPGDPQCDCVVAQGLEDKLRRQKVARRLSWDMRQLHDVHRHRSLPLEHLPEKLQGWEPGATARLRSSRSRQERGVEDVHVEREVDALRQLGKQRSASRSSPGTPRGAGRAFRSRR